MSLWLRTKHPDRGRISKVRWNNRPGAVSRAPETARVADRGPVTARAPEPPPGAKWSSEPERPVCLTPQGRDKKPLSGPPQVLRFRFPPAVPAPAPRRRWREPKRAGPDRWLPEQLSSPGFLPRARFCNQERREASPLPSPAVRLERSSSMYPPSDSRQDVAGSARVFRVVDFYDAPAVGTVPLLLAFYPHDLRFSSAFTSTRRDA